MGDKGMGIEHKYVDLAEFKAVDTGSGGWEGYLSKTGEIDDGGDLIVQGAYADTIDQFLTRGFGAESHDWTFSKMIGFPISAKEDEVGLFVAQQFHSTPDAQLVRTKVQERIAAGKGVYMSIGYEPAASPLYIAPEDYATEIPKYSRPELVETNLLMALRFPQVRVLTKVSLYEGSIVSVPMLRSAEVTSAKSADIQRVLDGLGTDMEYTAHLERLGTAVKTFISHTDARAEMRKKEGRVLSTANWQALAEMCDQMDELTKKVRSMLDEAKPKPKEENTDEQAKKDLLLEVERMVQRDSARRGVPLR